MGGDSMSEDAAVGQVTTKIPARLDRLPWSRFHWMVVVGLGAVWILDGLEVTIVSVVAGVLTEEGSGLNLDPAQVGIAAGIYIAGACLGALVFGQLTDRFGRKRLFLLTLAIYLAATALTAFSPNVWWFYICRFLTGSGIGGEYAAINSAIDELIPARYRGRVDLAINGSYWLGAAFGAVMGIVALNPAFLPHDVGWRAAFALGAVLGVVILLVRRNLPESPRWLFIHGRADKADEIVSDIERRVEAEVAELPEPDGSITVQQRKSVGFALIAKSVFTLYPRRAVLGFSLFIGQAFLYNAVFFTYAVVLGTFYGVPGSSAPWYLIPFAIGNFLGPVMLGPLFDTVGRVQMISGTYILSGALLLITGQLFVAGVLTPVTQTVLWAIVFFFASAGASSAYLTVSEIFPMETRALCIAFFYAIGTAAGGISGPVLFGQLVATGEASMINIGYVIGAALMAAAGVVELFLGVRAERQTLEHVTKPLTAVEVVAPASA
ncbi:MAG: MFS transporter [Streptosporangiales bacterium]|nr:MFS transporter [Streptosporangiales bacterium]